MSMQLLLILVYQKNPFIKTCVLCETKNARNNLCLKDLFIFHCNNKTPYVVLYAINYLDTHKSFGYFKFRISEIKFYWYNSVIRRR